MMVAMGNFLFRYRNGLFPLAALLMLIPSTAVFAEPLVAVVTGAGIALLGQILRIITIGYEYVIRGGKDRHVYAEKLITDGLYQLCRNPLYAGNLLIYSGVALTTNSLLCVVIAVPLYGFAYAAIVTAEEYFLRGKFGAAYERYVAAVPRWLPRLSALGETIGNGRFHWKRVLIKEYGTPFGWITAVFIISLWHLRLRAQVPIDESPLLTIVVAYVAVMAVYLYVRFLKHSRRMVAD
jgi:protein-S-isoprenylcysteine O-methyltransferase Ste14